MLSLGVSLGYIRIKGLDLLPRQLEYGEKLEVSSDRLDAVKNHLLRLIYTQASERQHSQNITRCRTDSWLKLV